MYKYMFPLSIIHTILYVIIFLKKTGLPLIMVSLLYKDNFLRFPINPTTSTNVFI